MPSNEGDTVDSTTSNLRSTSKWREGVCASAGIFGSVARLARCLKYFGDHQVGHTQRATPPLPGTARAAGSGTAASSVSVVVFLRFNPLYRRKAVICICLA